MRKIKITILLALLAIAVLTTYANSTDEMEYSDDSTDCRADGLFSDSLITAKIKMLYMKEPELSAFNIHVTTKGGMVFLTGEVGSEYEKNIAISLAANVKKVEVVYCNLNITFV